MTPPTPLNSSVAPMRSGATACTLRAKKLRRMSLGIKAPRPRAARRPSITVMRRAGLIGPASSCYRQLVIRGDQEIRMRVFLAGAAGAIGRRLVPLLLRAGHEVTGTTRSAATATELARAGVVPAVLDVFDAPALMAAVGAAKPAVVIHQLTDLPRQFDEARIAASYPKNARIRIEGTRNLIAAAQAAAARRFIVPPQCEHQGPGSSGQALSAGFCRFGALYPEHKDAPESRVGLPRGFHRGGFYEVHQGERRRRHVAAGGQARPHLLGRQADRLRPARPSRR